MSRFLIFITTLLFLSACTAFEKGIESRISEKTINGQQQTSSLDIKERNRECVEILNLPGISLEFELQNRITTHDSVWLLIIPIHWTNGRVDYSRNKKGKYKLRMSVTFNEKGYTFDYRMVKLYVDGKTFSPIDLRSWETIQDDIDNGKSIISFDDHLGRKVFYLSFDIKTPFPDQDIKLDLSEALINNNFPSIPVIQFKEHKWSRWYS